MSMHPAQAAWEETPEFFREQGIRAGKWLIERVEDEARTIAGQGLSDYEKQLLSSNPWSMASLLEDTQQHFSTEQEVEEFAGKLQADLNNLINNSVSLARSAIERAKAAGAPCVKVRRGLRIPEDWEDNYELVYSTNLPWFISHVMQSAFLGNPAVGETKPWMSR